MTKHPVYSIGQRVGDYQLLRKLGGGGFGDVYLAEQIYDGNQFAVKLLTRLTGDRDELNAMTRFIQEARMILLNHPNIVPLKEFGISREGIRFLVMEYAPRGTLRDHHPKGTQVPLSTVIAYVRQTAAALQYMHDHRLVHCDVKPENMLLRADGTVLLSDFSIVTAAHGTGSLILDKEMGGSLPYMAPERFQGRALRESDQYGLGVVVYEWLSGKRPYERLTEFARLQGRQKPPSLIAQMPVLDSAVEQIIFRALEDDPRNRFDTVQEFADALEEAGQLTLVTLRKQGLSPAPPEDFSGSGVIPNLSLVLPDAHTSIDISRHTIARGISRRTITKELALVGITLTGGGLAWFIMSRRQNSPVTAQTPEPSPRPTPTPVPMGRVLYTYRKHTALVNAVAWSPDGRYIASGANDTTVQVWNPTNGGSIFDYRGHSKLVEAVAWSPDGQRIASGSFDKTVQVWNAANGKQTFTYQGHTDRVATVAWSPDSKRIASGSYDNTVQVWDAADGSHVITYKGHTSLVHTLAWSRDGKHIASASFDKTVQVWDAGNGNSIFTYRGHSPFPANAVSWSPDGRRIASGGNDKTVQVWDSVDVNTIYTYRGHKDIVDTVAWSPDGRRIASGGNDDTVQVWDATNGSLIFTYRQHHAEVRAVAWSLDSTRIASCGTDMTVQVWVAG